jgi:hypothetical protein
MRKWIWTVVAAVPLAIAGGLLYANAQSKADQPQHAGGYVCPITGEELPCPNCCPLNNAK